MKKNVFLITILILLFVLNIKTFSQVLIPQTVNSPDATACNPYPKLNLSGSCNAGPSNFDPFYIPNNNCLIPWEVSHGTPQISDLISGKTSLLMYAALDSNYSYLSEGAFYRHKFASGKKYKLTFSYTSHTQKGIPTDPSIDDNAMDNFAVYFANDLQTVTTRAQRFSTLTNPDPRSYKIPNINSKEVILSDQSVQNNTVKIFEATLIPRSDYDFLWFYVWDNYRSTIKDPSTNQIIAELGASSILVWDIQIECLTSESLVVVPGTYIKNENTTTDPFYKPDYIIKPLPSNVQAQEIIVPTTPINQTTGATTYKFNGYSIIKGIDYLNAWDLSTFPPDYSTTTLTASTKISILNENKDNNSKYFEAEKGSSFEAKIETNSNCLCKDPCGDYLPWQANIISTANISVIGDNGIFKPWTANYSYWCPKPYNAYKYTLEVFAPWGGLIYSHVGGDFVNGINETIQWPTSIDEFNNRPSGVYTYTLRLENCFGTKLISSDISLVKFAPNPVLSSYLRQSNNTGLTVTPNPAKDEININFTSKMDNSNYELSVFSIDGRLIYFDKSELNNDNFFSKQIDISSFQSGIYFIKIKNGENWFNEKIVKL